MKLIIAILIALSANSVLAGEIEYTLTVTGFENDYMLIFDHRRNEKFKGRLEFPNEELRSALIVYTKDLKSYWRYLLANVLPPSTGVTCYDLGNNIRMNTDLDDFHFIFDPATLAVKRTTATPKDNK